jgi:hypothetical protein
VVQIPLPFQDDWPEGYKLAAAMGNFRFPQCVPTKLETIINTSGADGIQLIQDCLMWNPDKRPTASGVCLN